ncbi:hypothetical protein [Variovorax sp. PAMC28562]|uniref:hypothetical protein n=1 Tax=Variovorax sp. PAMC28562 TaxID=2762323 RepID=UPI0021C2F1A5|nr:hypothetical protein [Variovorax sp. PAMC28562]
MPDTLLGGLRILVTQADDFMGPTLCEVLAEHGADVIASRESLIDPTAPAAVVTAAGRVDVLIANLAVPSPSTEVVSISDDEWRATFAALVDPLPRLVRAVLPSMIERRRDAFSSWAARRLCAECAARRRTARPARPRSGTS